MSSGQGAHSRKLAVILHADVAGSTSLVRLDESLAHDRITNAFNSFTQVIEHYGGTVQEVRGDALVAEFDRASDAVCAALNFQQSHIENLRQLNDDIKPAIRIGVTLGEVVIADDTVTGEGIVLAQRVEQLTKPGGLCITSAIREALPSRMSFDQTDLGEQELKGFEEKVRIYSVGLKPGKPIPSPEPKTSLYSPTRRRRTVAAVSLTLVIAVLLLFSFKGWELVEKGSSGGQAMSPSSSKPSIAVLPFDNLSEDASQEYFSDGITEDIITDLSQLGNLAVIARNSSFTYKDTVAKAQDIGKDLGAGYLLEGSVRKAGDRVRITAQLIDSSNGQSLWAERYDRRLIDIFELQDEIRNKIVSALSIQLVGEETKFSSRKATNSFDAYDLFLKGRQAYKEVTLDQLKQAELLYRQAIELDPEFARAYGAIGMTVSRQTQIDFTADDRIDRLDRALEAVEKAVSIEPSSPQVQWALGYVHMWRQEYEQAAEAVEQSVALSPNYSDGWALLALINNQLGRGEQALRFIRKAMMLDPHHTWEFPYNEGRAYYNIGEYQKAVRPLLEALERNAYAFYPRLYLAATYIRLGQLDDAEWEATQLEIMNPGITISGLEQRTPISEGEHRNRFFADLTKAGIPE